MEVRYANWALSLEAVYPDLAYFLGVLPHLSVDVRKVFLTATRVQPYLVPGCRFYERHSSILRMRLELPTFSSLRNHSSEERRVTSVLSLLESLQPVFESSIQSGLLSIAIRSAPYLDYSSVEATAAKTFRKEMDAALNRNMLPQLSFTPILSSSYTDRFVRMYDNLPLDPAVHTEIHTLLEYSKGVLRSKHIVFPRVSTKTIGAEARFRCESAFETDDTIREMLDDAKIESIVEIERVYHRTGIKLAGPVEVRSAWKYNDLKPRVYYAQGPSAYHASKYIQPICNWILDCFPVVHRINRFEQPTERRLDELIDMIIYDYSSFTSSLDTMVDFVDALAEYYDDVEIRILDTHHGIVTTTVGDLFREYSRVCNHSPEFWVNSRLSKEEVYACWHSCGMLGVPGNISICTLLHGIHIAIVCESLGRCRVIGDDAKVFLSRRHLTLEQFNDAVSNLGDTGGVKDEVWTYDADPDLDRWHYAKRPLARFRQSILEGSLVTFPSLECILSLSDDYHRASFSDKPWSVRRAQFCKQFARLLDFLVLEKPLDSDRDLLYHYQRTCYRYLKIMPGRAILHDNRVIGMSPPLLEREEFGRPWRAYLMERWEGLETLTVPLFREYDDYPVLEPGCSFVSRSHAYLSLLEKLGYVEKELETVEVHLPSLTLPEFVFFVDRNYSFSYKWTVTDVVPSWAYQLTQRL